MRIARERTAAANWNENPYHVWREKAVSEKGKAGRKPSGPTTPRLLKSGLGGWQREKTPAGELDAKAQQKLNERRRRAESRAAAKARAQFQENFGDGNATTAATAAREAPVAQGATGPRPGKRKRGASNEGSSAARLRDGAGSEQVKS